MLSDGCISHYLDIYNNKKRSYEFLGISINTLYGYCSKRIIPFYKPGGSKVFFDREELIAWIKENKKASHEEIEEETLSYLQR